MSDPLIAVTELKKHYPIRLGAFGQRRAVVQAVDNVSFTIHKGETLSIVGESGCGKSTVGLTLLRLHEPSAGTVTYDGVDIATLDDRALRPYRRRMQIIFQDPYSTLNPRMTIGNALAEPIRYHKLAAGPAVTARVGQLLEDVGLTAAFAARYPHELSGGQRQRVAVARALACEPEFVVCDEAISALDVSVQAQIINLLQDLQEKYGLTYLFIAHDLAVVRHMSDRVGVMYLGRLAELAPRDKLFATPRHPYTRALLAAVPRPNVHRSDSHIGGDVPSPLAPPSGCYFHTRCPMATDLCRQTAPAWRDVAPDHKVACHHA